MIVVIILDKDEFTSELMDLSADGQRIITIPITRTQYDAAPTTPEEIATLKNGVCPNCCYRLGGYNGRFCVKDQIWWKTPIPPAVYITD